MLSEIQFQYIKRLLVQAKPKIAVNLQWIIISESQMAGIEMINDFTESSKAIIESSGNRVRCLNSVMPSTCKGSVLKLSWQTLSLDYFPLFP